MPRDLSKTDPWRPVCPGPGHLAACLGQRRYRPRPGPHALRLAPSSLSLLHRHASAQRAGRPLLHLHSNPLVRDSVSLPLVPRPPSYPRRPLLCSRRRLPFVVRTASAVRPEFGRARRRA
eukprot:152495-Pyramimonas_sp.AAC.1